MNRKPVLAFCGPGRCGKDTAAAWFRDHTNLVFLGGCSWTAREYMAKRLSEDEGHLITPDEAYERRHEDRMKWYTYLNEYRKDDPARLIRDCLKHSDIVCGIRDHNELFAARREGLLELIVWIERTVPYDPTLTYTQSNCDIIVNNNDSLITYHDRLWHLALAMGLDLHL